MEVTNTALCIIASMKRDWMQTGRKPSGLCGAAIYISALSQGHTYSKSDVVKIVHICEATLTKRLIEFENTNSGSLTIEEFVNNAKKLEKELRSHKLSGVGSKSSGAAELLCKHKGSSEPPFAHGLCSNCYDEFIELSGGLQGGSDPPAFQHVERDKTVEISAEEPNESDVVDTPHQDRTNGNHATETCTDMKAFAKANQKVNNSGKTDLADSEIRNAAEDQARVDSAFDISNKNKAVNTEDDDSDYLSDIDDIEVNKYLNSKEEIHYRKIIWEELNKEYLEEQAAKEAAAPAAGAKSRKERQQKHAAEAKNGTPAQTAAEATRHMLTKKRLSSKINYDVLEQLFNGGDPVTDSKKSRIEFQDDRDATKQDPSENEHEASTMDNSDEFGLGDKLDAEELDGEDEHESYFDNNDDFDDY